ncbi:uncharacterized protein EDB91DRAFT_1088755 [Suillus paluster]|uniref:uncharacterized protein n=1 Tax=Suillus paluster TaxID=48578 RepID=UPI001B87A63A|nr:uncharacterized protein EDB91DRAFT_1088755 [Suillus paluster]KAG1720622.1 hypothetical protein EDB91DRAFT_1088755 [Suillus paluster]
MDPSKIRQKCERFRILVIGRANAGKTTILKRVCDTQENPEIYDSSGEKRGEHDIENEMVFRSNPGFIFHDSRGFEAGGQSEFDKVKAFIASRSEIRGLKDRIHIIWYCIPMDEASRSFTEGELKFFSHCDTGTMIVVFTKFDASYDVEFAQLRENGASRKDARELAPKSAEESFANGPQLKFLYNSKDIRRPPKCHVCLPNMDKDGADCGPLIARTAETLDNQVLKQLTLAELVDSTQTTSSGIFRKSRKPEGHEVVIGKLGAWFPHLYQGVSVSIVHRAPALLTEGIVDPLTARFLLTNDIASICCQHILHQVRAFLSKDVADPLSASLLIDGPADLLTESLLTEEFSNPLIGSRAILTQDIDDPLSGCSECVDRSSSSSVAEQRIFLSGDRFELRALLTEEIGNLLTAYIELNPCSPMKSLTHSQDDVACPIHSQSWWIGYRAFPIHSQYYDGTHPLYKEMKSSLNSLASGSSTLEQIMQLSSATIIILEYSFYLWDQQHSSNGDSVRLAVKQYMKSLHAAAVREAVGTAIRTYQENMPSVWKAKLSSGGPQRKAELINSILEQGLDARKCGAVSIVFGVEPYGYCPYCTYGVGHYMVIRPANMVIQEMKKY